jgi:predicted metal-dependent peptidase
VVACDTSGSIGPKEVDMFFAELGGIFEDLKPKQMLVMWCDAKVHRTDELDAPDDLNHVRYLGAPGGGGTSFVPVFDEVDKLGIEVDGLIYLTDGYGAFPQEQPKYEVIWGDISKNAALYPWGDYVEIPRQAA